MTLDTWCPHCGQPIAWDPVSRLHRNPGTLEFHDCRPDEPARNQEEERHDHGH